MTSHRRGITSVDLMVVALIVAALFGLILPTIQSSRRIVCRTYCVNSLRCVGLGLQGYLDARGHYPNAGTFRELPGTTDPDSSTIRGCFTDVTGVGFHPAGGLDSKSLPDRGPLHSWVVDVLPYIDAQDLADAWNHNRSYASTFADPGSGFPSNARLGGKSIGVLMCPEDTTRRLGEGNLSYVVNGGFSRWVGDPTIGWTGTSGGGHGTRSGPDWGIDVAAQAGVMFLGTDSGDAPWDRRTTSASLVDGASQTMLASENLRAGASPGSTLTGGLATNWACPHPNTIMFVASDKICPGGGCPSDMGAAWALANSPGKNRFESINHGAKGENAEGVSPFPSSNHAGGVNVLLCDGSVRFLPDTIDGTVYARLITPAGGRLPAGYRQLPFADEGHELPW